MMNFLLLTELFIHCSILYRMPYHNLQILSHVTADSNPFQLFNKTPNSYKVGRGVGILIGFFERNLVGFLVGIAGLRVGLLLGFPVGFLRVGLLLGLRVGFLRVGRGVGRAGPRSRIIFPLRALG